MAFRSLATPLGPKHDAHGAPEADYLPKLDEQSELKQRKGDKQEQKSERHAVTKSWQRVLAGQVRPKVGHETTLGDWISRSNAVSCLAKRCRLRDETRKGLSERQGLVRATEPADIIHQIRSGRRESSTRCLARPTC
jgi:hypothetical protein